MRLLKLLGSATIALLACTACSCQSEGYFSDLPSEADPIEVGKLLTQRFLDQGHSQYGSPLRIDEPRTQITYPDVCLWLGGVWFAQETHNKPLLEVLESRFEKVIKEEPQLLPYPIHVDNNVFGALALSLYQATGKTEYKDLGLEYADTQWTLPDSLKLNDYIRKLKDRQSCIANFNFLTTEQVALSKKGYSWQTRFWLDDMFMITAVQGQAYRVTKDKKYLNRIANEMVIYLDSIQQGNGLFYHSPSAPFCWGRGNGWMAVGMTEVLRVIPQDNPNYPHIMQGYLEMMETLKRCQGESGLWKQLVDDPTFWDETSGSAMFAYAMIVGVKRGWLPRNEYEPCAKKAWVALCNELEPNGDLKKVCEGTDIGTTTEHYRDRKSLTGDYHGQAPMLWCAYALTAQEL